MWQAICRAMGCFCYHGNLIKWWVIDIRWCVYQIEFILRNMEYWWLLGLIVNEISIARIDLVLSLRIDYWSLTPIIYDGRLSPELISIRHNSLSSLNPFLCYRLRFVLHPFRVVFHLIVLSCRVCIKPVSIYMYSIYRYSVANSPRDDVIQLNTARIVSHSGYIHNGFDFQIKITVLQ